MYTCVREAFKNLSIYIHRKYSNSTKGSKHIKMKVVNLCESFAKFVKVISLKKDIFKMKFFISTLV